jgi:hypothetical protein
MSPQLIHALKRDARWLASPVSHMTQIAIPKKGRAPPRVKCRHPRILFAQALIRTGYVHKNIRLVRNGQRLLLKTIRELDSRVSPAIQLELPLGDRTK